MDRKATFGGGRTGLKPGASRRLARAQIRKVNPAGRDTGASGVQSGDGLATRKPPEGGPLSSTLI
jgi:hypothetical protein